MNATEKSAIPLTFEQLFYLEFFNHQRSITMTLRLHGLLDPYVLKTSLEELIRRHDTLRTRILTIGGNPAQWVDEASERQVTIMRAVQASEEPFGNDTPLIQRLAGREHSDVIGASFTATILPISSRDHLLIWSIDHTVIDGFSLYMMFRELWKLYAGLCQSGSLPIQRTSSQYVDYAIFQRDQCVSSKMAKSIWKSHLEGAKPIEWHRNCSVSNSAGTIAMISSEFFGTLSVNLFDVVKSLNVSLPLALLAIHSLMIARRCGQTDFVIPFVTGARDRSDSLSTLGFFARAMYMRIKLTHIRTYGELLNYMTREFYQALLHQDFGRVAIELPGPIIQTGFQFLSWRIQEEWGVPTVSESMELGLSVNVVGPFSVCPLNVPQIDEHFRTASNLELVFDRTAEGIRLLLAGNAALFDGPSIKEIATDLRVIAERLVSNPSAPIV